MTPIFKVIGLQLNNSYTVISLFFMLKSSAYKPLTNRLISNPSNKCVNKHKLSFPLYAIEFDGQQKKNGDHMWWPREVCVKVKLLSQSTHYIFFHLYGVQPYRDFC